MAGSGTRNSASHALQVARYGYDPETRRYVLQPDSPQIITDVGVEAATLAAGSNGQVWVAYVWSRRAYVAHTTGDGITWGQPFQLPQPADADPAELATIVAADGGMAVAWTGFMTDTLHLARHRNGDPDGEWTSTSTTVDGLTYGDDEMSVGVTPGGSILVLLRTSLDDVENRNNDAPQLVLARLVGHEVDPGGRLTVRDGHTGPMLLVDGARGEVHVIAEAENAIYLKRAAIDDPVFVTGFGSLLIAPTEAPPTASPSAEPGGSPSAEPIVPAMAAPSSTKQPLESLGEIVVIAADATSARYGHAVIALAAGQAPPSAEGHLGPLPDGVSEGLAAGERAFVFRTSFDSYAAGPGSIAGWTTRDEPADQLLTIAELNDGDRSLRLTPDSLGDGPRACRTIARSPSGVVVVEAAVQVRGTLESDAVVTALRGEGVEVASMRFGEPGTIRYFIGDERITSQVAFRAGAWYRSVVTLDVTNQTYDWQLTPLGLDAPILTVSNQPLRAPAPVIDEVCVQSADEVPGGDVQLLVDDVTVSIGPGG